MKQRMVAGLGGIGFAVLTVATVFLGSTPGGTYAVSDVKSYMSSGHHPAVFIALYAALLSVVGLICLLAGLRDLIGRGDEDRPGVGRVFLGTGIAAAATFAAGWCIAYTVPMAYAFSQGGGFALSAPEVYVIVEIGVSMVLAVGGVLLAVTMLILAAAAGSRLPSWLRWLTVVTGVLGLASIAFFPAFGLPIWSLAMGIWLLTSARRAQPAH